MREAYPEFQSRGADVAIVSIDTPAQVVALCRRYKCSFPCLSDPEADAYHVFGLKRGNITDVMGPRIMMKATILALKGNYGVPTADIFQLGGTFVIDREGVIRYCYRNRDAADNAPLDEVLAAL